MNTYITSYQANLVIVFAVVVVTARHKHICNIFFVFVRFNHIKNTLQKKRSIGWCLYIEICFKININPTNQIRTSHRYLQLSNLEMKFEFLFRLDYNLFLSESEEILSVFHTAKKFSKFLKFEFGIQKRQKSYINV